MYHLFIFSRINVIHLPIFCMVALGFDVKKVDPRSDYEPTKDTTSLMDKK